MTDTLYVNEDWSALVPAGSPEARFGIARVDAIKRGLLPGKVEAPAPVELTLTPKEAAKPTDKAIHKPRTK